MQPAQIKLRPDEKFLHHAKIQPLYFAGQIKRALAPSAKMSVEIGGNDGCCWVSVRSPNFGGKLEESSIKTLMNLVVLLSLG